MTKDDRPMTKAEEKEFEREIIAQDFFVDDLPPRPPAKKRKSKAWAPDVLALKRFCRVMDTQDANVIAAALQYLYSRYTIRRRV